MPSGAVGPEESERQKLISAGLLTPFGSSSEEKHMKQNSTSELASMSSHTPSPLSLVDFDWLGVNDSARNEHGVPHTSGRLSARKGTRKGKGKVVGPSTMEPGQTRLSPERAHSHSSHRSHLTAHDSQITKTLIQSSVEFQSEDEYEPAPDEAESSFCMSDEEKTVERKRLKLRELSSEDSDGELVHANWSSGKKRKKTVNRKRNFAMDDGSDELFQLRIRCVCVCVCVCYVVSNSFALKFTYISTVPLL